jgi:predicted GNAT family N-acyltransferase
VHLAVREEGAVVAIASLVPEPHPATPRAGDWRIRGMATAPGHRGRGLGAALVAACVERAAAAGASRVWCNARVGAAGLYERAGFAREGDVFDEPGIGPHVRMARPAR